MTLVSFVTKQGKKISFNSTGKKKRKCKLGGSGLNLAGQQIGRGLRGGSFMKKVKKFANKLQNTDWKKVAKKARRYGDDLQSGLKNAQEFAGSANKAYTGLTGKESEGMNKMIGKLNDVSGQVGKARSVGEDFASQYGMGRRRRRHR